MKTAKRLIAARGRAGPQQKAMLRAVADRCRAAARAFLEDARRASAAVPGLTGARGAAGEEREGGNDSDGALGGPASLSGGTALLPRVLAELIGEGSNHHNKAHVEERSGRRAEDEREGRCNKKGRGEEIAADVVRDMFVRRYLLPLVDDDLKKTPLTTNIHTTEANNNNDTADDENIWGATASIIEEIIVQTLKKNEGAEKV
uniref:Uncharacterized protein n=2 Tax=Heterosigma akashiwo TaxID=2829 RepID=A0A7S4DD49_HETAK